MHEVIRVLEILERFNPRISSEYPGYSASTLVSYSLEDSHPSLHYGAFGLVRLPARPTITHPGVQVGRAAIPLDGCSSTYRPISCFQRSTPPQGFDPGTSRSQFQCLTTRPLGSVIGKIRYERLKRVYFLVYAERDER